MDQSITLPDQVPVMPLPGALLFPHALLPLHIFEPRYQEMLEHALREHRMFAVALIKPQRSQWKSTGDFYHVAGVGLIRACVGRSDGTSNLILQGLSRARFTGFEQDAPFPIAHIEPLESETSSSVETDALGAKVIELYSKLKGAGRQLPGKSGQISLAPRRHGNARRPDGRDFRERFVAPAAIARGTVREPAPAPRHPISARRNRKRGGLTDRE